MILIDIMNTQTLLHVVIKMPPLQSEREFIKACHFVDLHVDIYTILMKGSQVAT